NHARATSGPHRRGSSMSAAEAPLHERLYTVEEFFRLLPDGRKADLIDGRIYFASADTPHTDDLGYLIRFLLQSFARAGNLGEAYGSRVAFVLAPQRAPEPDVSFVSSSRSGVMQKAR